MLGKIVISFVYLTYFTIVGNGVEVKTKLSPQEKQGLEKLRPLVQNELYKDYMKEDWYLVAFLRAKNLNVRDASEMIRTSYKWRKDNKIDGILNEDDHLRKSFPYFTDGIDYEGRPITSWDFGRWDIRKMSVSGSMPMLIRFLDRILEDSFLQIVKQRAVTGKDITQMVIIIDGYGFSARTHACVTCLPFYFAFITHTDMYFPQSGHAVHMINVPRIFDNVFNLIRPVMSPQVKDIIRVYGYDSNDWKRVFEKSIPFDQIRKQFGGTKDNTI